MSLNLQVMSILITSFFLTSCGVKDPPVKSEEIPSTTLGYQDTTVSSVSSGHDIVEITSRPSVTSRARKKEFETTDEYQVRLRELADLMKNRYPTVNDLHFFIPSNPPRIHYDADLEEFNISLLTVNNYTGERGEFTGRHLEILSSDFPVAIEVERSRYNGVLHSGIENHLDIRYEIVFKGFSKGDSSVNVALPAPRKYAPDLKRKISIGIVGMVVDPGTETLTIHGPLEKSVIKSLVKEKLFLSGVEFWVFNKVDFNVIAKYDSDLNLIYIYNQDF